MPGVAILLTVEYAALVGSYWNCEIAYPFYIASHILLTIVFGICVMEETINKYCTFPQMNGKLRLFILLISAIVGVYRWSRTDDGREFYHSWNLMLIGFYASDSYIVFCRSSEIKFTRYLKGKTYSITHEGIKEHERRTEEEEEDYPYEMDDDEVIDRSIRNQRNGGHHCHHHGAPDEQNTLIPQRYEHYHLPTHLSS